MLFDLVDRAYILWERQAQPRRARARLFAIQEPSVCAIHRTDLEITQRAIGKSHLEALPADRTPGEKSPFNRR